MVFERYTQADLHSIFSGDCVCRCTNNYFFPLSGYPVKHGVDVQSFSI